MPYAGLRTGTVEYLEAVVLPGISPAPRKNLRMNALLLFLGYNISTLDKSELQAGLKVLRSGREFHIKHRGDIYIWQLRQSSPGGARL